MPDGSEAGEGLQGVGKTPQESGQEAQTHGSQIEVGGVTGGTHQSWQT